MYANCLLFALWLKLRNWAKCRIIMQPPLGMFPYPPHFVCIIGELVYDFIVEDEDMAVWRYWFPFKGHIRVRQLHAYKIYHPERTDI